MPWPYDDENESNVSGGDVQSSMIDYGTSERDQEAEGGINSSNYLNGEFSVDFLSNKILKTYVKTCGDKWINCYHSYNKDRGLGYRNKIELSGRKLRNILVTYL
jgi:hypothetical protein